MREQDQEKIKYILDLLNELEYGSLVITVHDGQITQVDSTTKMRFTINKKRELKNSLKYG
ncbi:YezD family protein [Bacillus aquiflavi]|uniref:YezD family protein n=1 Tax=Bacillus aquiflavi TaxID=2672567 RepID=A0A6B3VXN7_9BACI|nr:YezD family protein [Bacillus aquiflavi]MBA4535936.1 YezD family protein [Bacillus aquiflavi]NEY80311.1 YezD family protein [Bacillus aquiflavi]UAC49821.1 YezD family protein [Bacillus aquiflavi]